MTNYAHLNLIETILMTIIAVATNFAALPAILIAFRSIHTRFEASILIMSLITSTMYHICEIYDCTIFLSELQWHRLDNVFAITAFQLIILHAFGSITDEDKGLRLLTLMSSIVIQEKDPWNVSYTVAPCVIFVLVAIGIRIRNNFQRKITYDKRRFGCGLLSLLLGLSCFVIGLDDAQDYLRIFHGLWHLLASLFGYCCLSSVKVLHYRQTKSKDNSDQSLGVQAVS